jgi:hypothetical protein
MRSSSGSRRLALSCLFTLSLALLLAAKPSLGATPSWATPPAVKMTISQKSTYSSEMSYTVLRKGSNIRIDGTFPVYGAFKKVPHAELYTQAGAFLYVPQLSAALCELLPLGQYRASVTYPVKYAKGIFEAPKELLQKELKRPARVVGQEQVAGRNCYVLSTADPKDSGSKEKRWIDEEYGIALKWQQIRSGKIEAMFETTDVSFADVTDASVFSLPADARMVSGTI